MDAGICWIKACRMTALLTTADFPKPTVFCSHQPPTLNQNCFQTDVFVAEDGCNKTSQMSDATPHSLADNVRRRL